MTYIPKLALELQSFSSVDELNHHMNLHYLSFKGLISKSCNTVFHLIKKYACRVAGVCWIKQDKLAVLADVSVKTVERAMKFLKERGVLKVYYTKRSNGLNGHSYYVLQPFQGELPVDDEEIVMIDKGNVGAGDCQKLYDRTEMGAGRPNDKLLLSSKKALKNSFQKNEEEMNNNARVAPHSNLLQNENSKGITDDEVEPFVQFLVDNRFKQEIAMEIVNRVLVASHGKNIHPVIMIRSIARALFKFKKRLKYQQPIFSIVDYFVHLVTEEISPGFPVEKDEPRKKPQHDIARTEKALEMMGIFKELLEENR
ncbi:hypothetical protein [Pseudoneobacillus sp. C159]